ncbi:MAG: Ig-like domain-containing protein [Hyphomicrobiales bacterium]
MGYRPGRWLFGLLPLALVGFAAYQLNTQRMETSLDRDAQSQLAAQGASWAQVQVQGRDVRILGTAPDDTAAKAVRDAVAGLYGVRRVDSAGVTIASAPAAPISGAPDTTPPAVPVLSAAAGYPPVLTGTWDSGDAKSLAVTVGGRTYKLGSDSELAATGDNWTLALKPVLADGAYDVVVTVADAAGNETKLEKKAALVVDTPAPPAPTVNDRVTNDPRAPISGTWSPDGKTLTVAVGGRTYVLGKDAALTSDANGAWTLTLDAGLPDGPSDVVATVTGPGGKTATDTTQNEIVIDTAPPAAPSAPVAQDWSGPPAPIVITGTYPASDAARLAVGIAGKTYTLGEPGSPLTAAGDAFTLALKEALPNGTYATTVEVADKAGNVSRSSADLTIAPHLKTPPRVSVLSGSRPDVTVAGSVDPSTKDLTVTIAGKSFRSGEADGPKLDASTGAWTLTLAAPLAKGAYDVVVEARDAAGGVSRSSTPLLVEDLDLTPPPAPTVTSEQVTGNTLVVSGTWSPKETDRLKVTVGDPSYVSGTSAELKALDTGTWTLTVPKPAADGSYAITAAAIDRAGNAAAAGAIAPVVIDTRSPALPTVHPVATTSGRPTITGTWPEGDAAQFTVTVDDQIYVMGKTPALQRTGPGQWSLTPTLDLPAGSHEVVAKVTDAAGNVSTDATRFELLIKEAAAAASTAGPAGDCARQFAEELAREQIRFKVDSVAIAPDSDALLQRLAEASKLCKDYAIEVSGHTDATGSGIYNRALSEGRAAQVVKRLVKLGVDADRLTAVGYGETQPVADNRTEDGRAQNRRIEFKVRQ